MVDGWKAWINQHNSPGQTIAGPAVIEAATTTVLLRPGDRAQVSEIGWLDVALSET
jgi:N-methylhydantoinase A